MKRIREKCGELVLVVWADAVMDATGNPDDATLEVWETPGWIYRKKKSTKVRGRAFDVLVLKACNGADRDALEVEDGPGYYCIPLAWVLEIKKLQVEG